MGMNILLSLQEKRDTAKTQRHRNITRASCASEYNNRGSTSQALLLKSYCARKYCIRMGELQHSDFKKSVPWKLWQRTAHPETNHLQLKIRQFAFKENQEKTNNYVFSEITCGNTDFNHESKIKLLDPSRAPNCTHTRRDLGKNEHLRKERGQAPKEKQRQQNSE